MSWPDPDDRRTEADILRVLLRIDERLASVHKHLSGISWVVTILFAVAVAFAVHYVKKRGWGWDW